MRGNAVARKTTPPFLRRRVVWFVLLIVALSLTSPLATLLLRNRVPAWAFVAAATVPGLGCGLLSVWFGRAMAREIKHAERLAWNRCWDCGYDLTGVAAAGICPECGRAYARDDLAAKWQLLAQKRPRRATHTTAPSAARSLPRSPTPPTSPGPTSPPGA